MPGKTKRRKSSATKPPGKAAAAGARKKRSLLAWLLLTLLIAFAVYTGYLNHLINARFEGDTWALPSRVYSRALE